MESMHTSVSSIQSSFTASWSLHVTSGDYFISIQTPHIKTVFSFSKLHFSGQVLTHSSKYFPPLPCNSHLLCSCISHHLAILSYLPYLPYHSSLSSLSSLKLAVLQIHKYPLPQCHLSFLFLAVDRLQCLQDLFQLSEQLLTAFPQGVLQCNISFLSFRASEVAYAYLSLAVEQESTSTSQSQG